MAPINPKSITTISFVALDPWNLFLTWEAPSGVNLDMIDHYEITGSFVQDYFSNTRYNFIPQSYGVLPNSEYVVSIVVVYKTTQRSNATSVTVTTPKSRKNQFFC